MKMQKAAMVLFSLVTVLCWSSVPALAQRGHGSGGGANPGGGMGASGTHGGMQGGMPGSQAGRGPQHPEMEHPKGSRVRGKETSRLFPCSAGSRSPSFLLNGINELASF